MRLSQKQHVFSKNWTLFLNWVLHWCDRHGYYFVIEEMYRHDSATHGHPNSCHRQKLAGHILLFHTDDGELVHDSGKYKSLGRFWKSLHEYNRWGGDFSSPDGCHFSMEHNGVR